MESAISQIDWNKLAEGKASPWVIAVLLVFLLLPFIKLVPSFVSMQRESRKTRRREAVAKGDRLDKTIKQVLSGELAATPEFIEYLRIERRLVSIEEFSGIRIRAEEMDAFLALHASGKIKPETIREAWPYLTLHEGHMRFRPNRRKRISYTFGALYHGLVVILGIGSFIWFFVLLFCGTLFFWMLADAIIMLFIHIMISVAPDEKEARRIEKTLYAGEKK